MQTVIVVPTIKDFLAELETAGPTDCRPAIYLSGAVRDENTFMPERIFGVRLTAQLPASITASLPGALVLWVWCGHVDVVDGGPAWAHEGHLEAYSHVGALVHQALKEAGYEPRPGSIAVDKNLYVVPGQADCLAWYTDDATGDLSVDIDEAWVSEAWERLGEEVFTASDSSS